MPFLDALRPPSRRLLKVHDDEKSGKPPWYWKTNCFSDQNSLCKGGLFFFRWLIRQRTLRRAQKLLEPQQEAKGWSCQFIGTRWAGGWPLRCSHTSCNGKWIPDGTCSNPVACNSQFALRKLLPHPSGFGPIPYTWDQTRFPAPMTGWPSVSRVVAQHAPRAFDVRC